MLCRGSGGFVVQERASLALTNIALNPSATLTVTAGSLSLASMVVRAAVLGVAEGTLSGAGGTLRLDAVTVPEAHDAGALTGTISLAPDGSKAISPPDLLAECPAIFLVVSGPCAVSEGGRCVGRAEGYGPNEDCAINVVGGTGVLGPCPVFDTGGRDLVTLPDSDTSGNWHDARHFGSDCPEGAALAAGDAIAWTSDGGNQGNRGGRRDNGCAAEGTCGLPYSQEGFGGGWELCFA
eukprot:COSAG04_NODE_216_length_19953_cov_85.343558_20_plen_237_part_00